MLIVKKMPILQGFPDFETVKNLSGNAAEDENFCRTILAIDIRQTSGWKRRMRLSCWKRAAK